MAQSSFLSRFKNSINKRINRWYGRAIEIRKVDVNHYVDLLRSGTLFSFARYGDGEWASILGESGTNCDGHVFTEGLATRLRTAVGAGHPYNFGIQRAVIRTNGRAVVAYLKRNGIQRTWYNADVFHDASRDGQLFPLIQQLRTMDVVVVGPEWMRALRDRTIPYADFVEIPSQNCFDHVNQTLDHINTLSSSSNRVFAFSASMMAKVLVHELYPTLGQRNWLIDFGALWDVYVGRPSRSYMTRGDWETNIRQNLGL